MRAGGRPPIATRSDFARRLAAAQEGDEAAFTELFRAVQPRLLRYLQVVAGPLAEDVAADTWLSVVRGLHRFSGDEAGWTAWVFTIARARLVDARRRAAHTPLPTDAADLLRDRADHTDVGECVEEMFSTEAALAVIALLPKDQAEVVLLRHIAGLDVARTAHVLGKPAGAIRIGSHRGLRRLAGLLAAGEDAPAGVGVTPQTPSTVTEVTW